MAGFAVRPSNAVTTIALTASAGGHWANAHPTGKHAAHSWNVAMTTASRESAVVRWVNVHPMENRAGLNWIVAIARASRVFAAVRSPITSTLTSRGGTAASPGPALLTPRPASVSRRNSPHREASEVFGDHFLDVHDPHLTGDGIAVEIDFLQGDRLVRFSGGPEFGGERSATFRRE